MDKVLLVEDDKAILFNVELFLKMHDFEVITAMDGVQAINTLQSGKIPDIIISDIMMPNMDGYTFYKTVSDNPNWLMIPFVFMSAKSSPEDIRFGKNMGVDDYLVKPFEEEDLLAIIKGKLKRSQKFYDLREKFEQRLQLLSKSDIKLTKPDEKKNTSLLIVEWNDKLGPHLTHSYPRVEESSINLDDLGLQLFNISSAIYGKEFFLSPEGTLIHLKQIDMDAYIFFNAVEDKESRAGSQIVMFVVLAEKIHYLASLRIREQLQLLSEIYLKDQNLDFKKSLKEIEGTLF